MLSVTGGNIQILRKLFNQNFQEGSDGRRNGDARQVLQSHNLFSKMFSSLDLYELNFHASLLEATPDTLFSSIIKIETDRESFTMASQTINPVDRR